MLLSSSSVWFHCCTTSASTRPSPFFLVAARDFTESHKKKIKQESSEVSVFARLLCIGENFERWRWSWCPKTRFCTTIVRRQAHLFCRRAFHIALLLIVIWFLRGEASSQLFSPSRLGSAARGTQIIVRKTQVDFASLICISCEKREMKKL